MAGNLATSMENIHGSERQPFSRNTFGKVKQKTFLKIS